ncbi:MOSC domain-containing protein YiiM [Mesorhizobium albiziae]|uniref:MOSC domain-containing protein YiiM n=1 Tax=Neomesorhizobium albiziae TaxID=335020 RepID=A0A1I4D910_9HYPH|nr:MOSC domain-containing protein [Mesorhizobium albiziae]GLS33609.1 molybdenum cofactor sulfurase [Mesorhizobium albiziae]SFK89300.1 MOSC domain-containing protein YiiM [Mesorhizobium albiziae]
MTLALADLLVGQVAPLGNSGLLSGINKRPVARRLWLSREGLEGDAQADLKIHGGVEKAVHHYPREHYDAWRGELGGLDMLTRPGAFGENFSTRGLDERTVAIGDVFRVGDAIIEVSQGRQPCHKLNARFGVADMALRVQKTGWTGWYYRVRQEGFVAPGEAIHLIDRRSPDWTLQRLWRILYVDTFNIEELSAMLALAHLPERWRRYAQRRLETRQVEDWSKRLWASTSES